MSVIRKLTTRPIWKWEKARRYPIKQRWENLPPVTATGSLPMVVLTTPATFPDAMWTAWSWLRFLAADVRLELAIDGEATPDQRRGLGMLFPGARLVEAREIVAAACSFPPLIRAFVENHPIGRKLGLTLQYQARGRFLFSDADILAFNKPSEMLAEIRNPQGACYMVEPNADNFDEALLVAGRAHNLAPRPGFNAGLLLSPQGWLDLPWVEELLSQRTGERSYFTEQTLFALCLPPEVQPLPPERYVVSTKRQFYWETDVDYQSIAARHFTGPTRHVMYLKGLPLLERAARG